MFWCCRNNINPFRPVEKDILEYLNFLLAQGRSYSVINTVKSMLTQTLPFFGVDVTAFTFLERMLKGCFNINPPRARYSSMWDVGIVLKFLFKLYPVEDLTLKNLTLKLITLIAITTAARSQTLNALDLDNMSISNQESKVTFVIRQLLKTSRPGNTLPKVILDGYSKPELCVVKTLLHYIERTKDVRKTSCLFVSYVTYNKVTTSTLARWIKTVLCMAGVDINVFKAHSVRSASSSAAFASGCSIKDILTTANWSNAKTFKKFYNKEIEVTNVNFPNAVLGRL